MKQTLLIIALSVLCFSCTKSTTPAALPYYNNEGITFTANHAFTYSNANAPVTNIILDQSKAIDGKKATFAFTAINGYDLEIVTTQSPGVIKFETGSLDSKNSLTAEYNISITYHAAVGVESQYFSVNIVKPN